MLQYLKVSWEKWYSEVTLQNNDYPKNFIDLRLKKLLDKLFVKNKNSFTVQEK